MEQTLPPRTIIPFTRQYRWRWWLMVVVGGLLMAYGLALLTSPAWARFGIVGESDFWVWVRGELYLIFGFLQCFIGIGYIRLTSRPAEAIEIDRDGIALRRLYETQRIAWSDVTEMKRGRSSVLIGPAPITAWKTLMFDPTIMRLDTTIVKANVDELADLIERYRAASSTG